MSIDLIEAAWSDPILRSELLASDKGEIPEHPAGIVTSPGLDSIDGGAAGKVNPNFCWDRASDLWYYIISYFSHPICCG
jgi:mersacidin/lichenicidin family type 2 lantibiotic